jgi:DNA-binding NarL/FixJ family response regulator
VNADTRGTVRQLLLIEPDGLVRSTVASVCRDLQLARVWQITSVAMGEQWLKSGHSDGLLISLTEGDASLAFLTRLREGGMRCDPGMPVAAMAREADAALVTRLKELDVRRFLLQPFRLRDVIHTVEQLWPAQELAGV